MRTSINWLMQGDPVIRWQVLRDLLDRPEEEWQAVRRETVSEGWGRQFAECLLPDGTWPAGRWTDTVWTLLTIIDCGIPADYPPIRDAALTFLDRCMAPNQALDEHALLQRMDLCHLGFWLRIGAWFTGSDSRLTELAGVLLRTQMADGGWNCRIRTVPRTRHSSLHTTFNVLEGLSLAAKAGIISAVDFRESEARALEFALTHQMYRSDKTGEIISERFTHLAFPTHWHYTVLRGLDYLRDRPEIGDSRLDDPVALLLSRRDANGCWPVEKRIPGATLFDMEPMGRSSRWNTLRALRVLKCRQSADDLA